MWQGIGQDIGQDHHSPTDLSYGKSLEWWAAWRVGDDEGIEGLDQEEVQEPKAADRAK